MKHCTTCHCTTGWVTLMLVALVVCPPCLAGEADGSIMVGDTKAMVQIADNESHKFSYAYQPHREPGSSQLELEIMDDETGLVGMWAFSETDLMITLHMGGAPVEIHVAEDSISVAGTACEGISAECVAKLLRPHLEGVSVEMLIATLAILWDDLDTIRFGEEIIDTFHILIEDLGVPRQKLPKTEKLHTNTK